MDKLFMAAILGFFMTVGVAGASGLTATPNPFTLTNGTIDMGQISIASTVVSGGAGAPYTGGWTFLSSNQVNNQVVNTITVSSHPSGVAFNPQGTLAYVTDGGDTVSVINVATNTVVNTITVGVDPYGVAFNPQGTLAYVANSGGDTVSVINVATNTVVNTITVGSSPQSVAFNPQGTLAYVANSGSYAVNVINVATNTVVNTITVGAFQYSVAFNPQGTLAYVGNAAGKVSVINVATNTVVNTITVGAYPYGVAFNPQGTLAYVANSGSDTVSVINVATNTVNTIPVGQAYGVAFNPQGTLAYVANYNSGTVSVINVATNTVVNTITVGSSPQSVAFNPQGALAYVANYNSGTVSVIGNLPETSLQPIPSSNSLQLTVNAISSNTISFTFNGVTYTDSTGSQSIYGTWALSAFAQDNHTAYYYGSNDILLSNTITVNPAPTATSLTPSSATLDLGQYETYNVLISGGTPTFTANLIYVSGPSGATVNSITAGNIVETLTGQSDGTITFPSFNGFSTAGSYTFNVVAVDSASTPVTFSSASNTITVNLAPTATSLTPRNASLYIDQNETYNVIISAGTGPFTANLIYVRGPGTITIGANALGPGNVIRSNTISTDGVLTFNSFGKFSTTGSYTFNVIARDSSSPPVTFNSIYSTISVNPRPSGSAGPSTRSTSISDNVNSSINSTTPVISYTIFALGGSVYGSGQLYQSQLPHIFTLSPADELNMSFACSFATGSTAHYYQNDVIGLGYNLLCNKNYTVSGSSYEVIYNSTAATTTVVTTVTTTVPSTTTIPAVSLPPLPNHTLVIASNATANTLTTLPYSCSLPSNSIAPYLLKNGTWTKITPFTVNATACTISFMVPVDPVVAIFTNATTSTTTLPTSTTTLPTTFPTTTVPYAAHQTPAPNYSVYIAAIIVILIIVAVAYYLAMHGMKHHIRMP